MKRYSKGWRQKSRSFGYVKTPHTKLWYKHNKNGVVFFFFKFVVRVLLDPLFGVSIIQNYRFFDVDLKGNLVSISYIINKR